MMKPAVKLLLLLFCALLTFSEGKSDGEPLRPKDLEKVKVDAKGFDKIKTIHTNWYVHSVKALIAQLSRNILPKLSDDAKKTFLDCLSTIHDKKDLVESSKCVVKAREQYDVDRKSRPKTKKLQLEINVVKPKKKFMKKLSITRLEELEKEIPMYFGKPGTTTTTSTTTTTTTTTTQVPTTTTTTRKLSSKKELLEKKRKVLERARYLKNAGNRVMSHEDRMRVWKNEKKMELVKKSIAIREFRRKWRLRNFRMPRRPNGSRMHRNLRFKRSLTRLVVDSVSKSDGEHGFFVKTMDRMPSLKTRTKSPVERVTSLLRTFLTNQNSTDPNWADTYKALINLKKKMDEKEKESGARVYNERMLDLVLDTEPRDKDLSFFDKKKMPGLVRNAFDLMSTIERTGKKGDSNFKFLSPRFASVMPDKNENRGRLSPSILSFYNDESEDQILPLPKMLDATGMRGKDRDSILELVMEVSGVKSIVHDAMKMLKSTDMPELDLAMNDNAKKSLQMVQDIQKSYNRKQKKEMKNSGFTLLDPKQMEKLMTDQGIAGRDDIFNLREYALLTMVERKEMVWDMIRGIAFGVSGLKAPPHHIETPGNFSGNGTVVRVKRQGGVWGPHILTPTVLTPLLFTPIYGLNVLGPTVLSPGLFTPLILNPAVLSPYVFSPTVGIPFILSPYLLSPYVFSPLVMAPFILNPYVLAPNVFNPYVLSPLILSPLVICPDVVSPMTLGGAILSPAVLSPSLLSKSYVMANVLSPTFLS